MSWHHPDCEGECIACLIEREVKNTYGNQGLGYLQRHVASSEWQSLTDAEIQALDKSTHFHESPDWGVRFARAIEQALKEKNQ